MLSIGYDIGSSSVKAAVVDIETGDVIGHSFYPKEEMNISSPVPGWAEQDPEVWWNCVVNVTNELLRKSNINPAEISCIGISYQMHGLVLVDRNHKVLRSSIIWCDSRAVEIGKEAFNNIGNEVCLYKLLNSPGNFTASKLRWVKENEPEIYKQIYKIMLPGDFIGMKMTDQIFTTISGLSEGVFWDFRNNKISREVIDYYEISEDIIADIRPVFSEQGKLSRKAADLLGLKEGIPVAYRAGDQPNNALSLNVFNPGEIAATAGTSGVVYAVTENLNYDKLSRVNHFAHVNYSSDQIRIGILLCVNGTGILNSWIRRNLSGKMSYEEMNKAAAGIQPGSAGVTILPFGNGAERVLENRNIGSRIYGLDFNQHSTANIIRASQEGIAFALNYGIELIKHLGLEIRIIRAGLANLFLSPVFAQTLSNISNAEIQLFNTDGAQGAARGAAFGAGLCKSLEESLKGLKKELDYYPLNEEKNSINDAYARWLKHLKNALEESNN